MLRIEEIANGNGGRIYRLEGKLLGPWVEEVRRVLTSPSIPPRPAVLDLSRVTYADATGTRLLRELIASGVTIEGCSAFVAELLKRERT
jgi:hypothetical protein